MALSLFSSPTATPTYIKAMVACHPYRNFLVDVHSVDLKIDGERVLDSRGLPVQRSVTKQHWAQGFIARESEKFAEGVLGGNNRAVRYYTVDKQGMAGTGPEIKGDVFSPEFARQRERFFDLAFLPDCGGLWYESQVDGDAESLARGLGNVAKTVRRGGKIFLGKILDEDVVETAIGILMSQGVVDPSHETKAWNYGFQENEDRYADRASISSDGFLKTYVLKVV
mgnify:CR=1 FL=1